ncbi:type I secretion system permease/ATPase [Shewanella mangrovisoli]|uniref:type I secretion system permease/ATPase n=1 Tax=Shewanella mangrovisoli TaxID=2864211 RepID=UPI0035B7ADD9
MTINTKTPTDAPFLAIILLACAQFDCEADAEQILTGLHLDKGQLNTDLLQAALFNAGLEACEQNADFTDIALPAILLNRQQQPFLAISREANKLHILDAQGEGTQLDKLQYTQHFHRDSWHLERIASIDARGLEHHQDVDRHWLLAAFDEVRPFYGSFLLGSLVINILALITPLFTMNVYDRVVPNQAIDTLWVLATGATIAIVFDWLLRQARTKLADVAGKHIDVKLSNLLFRKVLGMRLESRPASAGAFAKQMQDFDSIRDFITSATLVSAVDLPFTLLFLILIAWLGGIMVLVPLTCMIVLIIISLFMQRRLMHSIEKASQFSTQRQAHLVETLNLLIETKQNNGETKAQRIWDDNIRNLADWQNESRIASNTLTHSVMNSQQLVTIGLIVTGVYQIHAGNLSMGGLIAIVMLSGRAASAINQIAMLVLKFKQTQQAITAVESILALPQENRRQESTIAKIPFSGAFSLRNASLTYPEQTIPAFNGIDLDIKAGEKIGLYGPAGAGKSSLLCAIAGQYQLSSGQLFYNQIESRQWSIDRIRQHIGWMSQQPVLIYGSVLDNLLYGLKNVNENLLASAMVASGIDRLMDRLGSGLDSQVGEFGRQLSGGQRQAIALCRALLREPKLLLLDEPTSAMDERAENQVIACLKAYPTPCTIVIASHNPKVLSLCDRVFMMDKGGIISEQTPTQLATSLSSRRIKAVSISRKENNA